MNFRSKPPYLLHFYKSSPIILQLLLCSLWLSSPLTHASDESGIEINSEFGAEAYYYPEEGAQGQSQQSIGFHLESEFFHADTNITFQPFFRFDSMDSDRTHADIRELTWQHSNDYSEYMVGISRVFWGRMEFTNFVDVINQTDLIEDPSGKTKLGQPMTYAAYEFEEGLFEFYLLFGFRALEHPGEDGRLRFPMIVDDDNAVYNGSSDKPAAASPDFAFRWSRPIGDYTEIALSQFKGLSRDPTYRFNGDLIDPRLTPFYDDMHQTGIELEVIYEGWAFKLESIYVDQDNAHHYAAGAGVEYTFFDLFDSGQDLTAIVEYLYDSRGENAPTFIENDLLFGGRWSANNLGGTESIFGVLYDPKTEEQLFTLEATHRIGEQITIELVLQSILSTGNPNTEELSLVEQYQTLINSPFFDPRAFADQIGEYVEDLILGNDISQLFEVETWQRLIELDAFITTQNKTAIIEDDAFIKFGIKYYF